MTDALLYEHSPEFSYSFLQDRVTFRRIIVKNNAKKRKMFESFIESVLLKSLEVKLILISLFMGT